jgi:hypothetical protein
MKCEHEYLEQAQEEDELIALTIHLDNDLILKDLWDNEKDSIYEKNLSNSKRDL